MYKEDLALNNLQRLICHKTQTTKPSQTKPINEVDQSTLFFKNMSKIGFRLVWFVGFYGISTSVGYLMPNPFLCK